jgi:hypothetical protein
MEEQFFNMLTIVRMQMHRMQQMLEETLTKNMHLQQSLDHLSQVGDCLR